MPATNRITVVLRAKEGETLDRVSHFAQLGAPVAIGHGLGIITAASAGDKIEHAERLENQIVLAESAMRRGVVMHDKDHLPALRRVIDHVPTMYLAVADKIRQEALDDGSDPDEAEEMAGQAIRALVLFKQNLEAMLEPDLITTENTSVVAESVHIDERVKAAVAEPSFLTIVFKLPTLDSAAPLIAQLPYGQKALGTNAEVFGLTTGNLMEASQ